MMFLRSKITFIHALAFLLMVSAVGFGCQDDDSDNSIVYLHYDGDNREAPVLRPGTFEAAAHFRSGTMIDYTGYDLTEVEFYIDELPDNCEVFIRSSNGTNTPGSALHSSGNIINDIQTGSWNTYVLPEPLILDGQGIWIGVRFSQDDTNRRVIGCDRGPADVDGDWLFDSSDGGWIPFITRTAANSPTNTGISVNWNIRGVIDTKE